MKFAVAVLLAIFSVVAARPDGPWDVFLEPTTTFDPKWDILKMWGLDEGTIYGYLAQKIDLDMMKGVFGRHFGGDLHHLDIDVMRNVVARHMGLNIDVLDLHTLKMIIVKHMMDLEMMQVVFARFLGVDVNMVDINTLKMMLAKYVHLGIHTLEDLELLKMVMVKYMMQVEAVRTMGYPHSGINTGITTPHYYPYANIHNYWM